MFKKILVPLDGSTASECALEVAQKLGQLTGDELIVARATILQLELGCPPGFPLPEAALQSELDTCAAYLQEHVDRLRADGVKADFRVLGSGHPDRRIVECAVAEGVQLIVLTSHGRSGLRHFLLGSVAEKICRSAPCPVLLVGPASDWFARWKKGPQPA